MLTGRILVAQERLQALCSRGNKKQQKKQARRWMRQTVRQQTYLQTQDKFTDLMAHTKFGNQSPLM